MGWGSFLGAIGTSTLYTTVLRILPTLVDWLTPHTNTQLVSECVWNFENICHVKFVQVGDFLASLLLFYCKSKTIKSRTIFMCVSNFLRMSVTWPLFIILWDGWSHILVFVVIPRRYLFGIWVFQLAPLVWEQIQLYTRDGLYIGCSECDWSPCCTAV